VPVNEILNPPSPTDQHYYILAPSDLPAERDFVLKHDDTFALIDRFGDIDSSTHVGEGLYHEGTRFLSSLKLKFANGRPLLLSSTVRRDNVLVAADLTNPDVYYESRIFLHRGTIHIYRSQFLWRGALYQGILARNYSRSSTDISLTIEFGADFADIFEVRGTHRARRGNPREPRVGDGHVVLSQEGLDGVVRSTLIRASVAPQVTFPLSMHFTLRLEPDQEREIEMTFACDPGSGAAPHLVYVQGLKEATAAAEQCDQLTCGITTSNDQFNDWIERSRADLAMLITGEPQGPYPYGGVPWFACPFGRDGIITALECLWTSPGLARGVLAYLSANQAQSVSPDQDAEPGKILHEAREGEMAALGEVPFRRYYGSIDATPLYLILAGQYYRRTGDIGFVRSIWPNLELAVDWIDRYGDSDGDGFVEYSRRSKDGLVQQGWKDSGDSVFHANGELATGPIALCEVQGYVYAAKIEIAALAAALGHQEIAQRLMRDVQALQSRFEESFWNEELGIYALALDGEKKQCAVRTSNAGQCLFSGIASPDRARRVAEHLTGDRFYSGWGIRTVANSEARYNPMSYHNGSIWPHDNALIASGFSRYRSTELAARVLTGMFEVAREYEWSRLPELFCGFARRQGKGPTSYPVACSPQAWSAGAVFLLLQSAVGLSVAAMKNRITFVRPVLPRFLTQVRIERLAVGNSSVDLMLFRSGDGVAVTVERRRGDVDVTVLY
jgi:glycogen debranching enzyme